MRTDAEARSFRQWAVGAVRGIRSLADSAASAWNHFWFEPADPILPGIMRLLTGWMLFYTLCVWTLDLDAFFGPDGLQPLKTIQELHADRLVFSFWLWIDPAWLWPVHIGCLVVAAMYCVGLATRVTSVLAFLITISYSQRVPVANFGLDQILGLLTLYLALGPSGACCSLDAVIRRWWRHRRGLATPLSPVRSATARMAMRLIQLHLCAIYFWAGFGKLKGPSWWTGEAMWRVIANGEYQTLDLTWLAWVPWLPYLIAHVTILWEVFFVALIWNHRLRPLMLAVGTAMHLGIGAFLGMWTFGLIMIFAYVSFADPEQTRARLQAVGRTLRIGSSPKTSEGTRHTDLLSEPAAVAGVASASGTLDNSGWKSDSHSDSDSDIVSGDDRHAGHAVHSRQAAAPPDSSTTLTPASAESILSTSILVVAERSTDRSAIRRYLGSHGFSVRALGSLSVALECIAATRPELVLLISSGFEPDAFNDFCADVSDLGGMQIMAVLRPTQQGLATELNSRAGAHVLYQPQSLREIRQCMMRLLALSSAASPGTAAAPDSLQSETPYSG
jgi:CheY-like chemotaxis protein